jgi:hypothetical protein
MNQSTRRIGFLGLLGVWALVLGSPNDANAIVPGPTNTRNVTGIVASPVTVMPAPDPWHYLIPLAFVPNTSVGEFFAPNPAFPAPATDFFTITGFGDLIGVLGLSPLNDFSLVSAVQGSDTLVFDYTGTSDLSTMLSIGSILIDTDTLSSSITITYHDHDASGPFIGVNNAPVTLVPEPSAIALLGLGGVGGLYLRRRLARRAA